MSDRKNYESDWERMLNNQIEENAADGEPDDTAAPASPSAPEDEIGEAVSGATPDDELIDKILVTLGVDPADWSTNLSGIYAAIRSNMQIGEPQMSKIEDWTDAEQIPEDTLTATMFRLVEQAQEARRQLAAAQAEAAGLREAVNKLKNPLLKEQSPDRRKLTEKWFAIYEQVWANQQSSEYISTPFDYHEFLESRLERATKEPLLAPAPDAVRALVVACEPFAKLWREWDERDNSSNDEFTEYVCESQPIAEQWDYLAVALASFKLTTSNKGE